MLWLSTKMDIEEKLFFICFALCVVSFSLGFTQLEPRTRFAIVMDVALIVSMIVSSIKKKKKAIEDKNEQEAIKYGQSIGAMGVAIKKGKKL